MKKREPTILIVEDDPDDQFMLTRGFKKTGVTTPIHVVNNGLEAIAYMMGEGIYANREAYCYPTFIMTDLKMPGADGFAVLEFLKKNPQWGRHPHHCFFGFNRFGRHQKGLYAGSEFLSCETRLSRSASPSVTGLTCVLDNL